MQYSEISMLNEVGVQKTKGTLRVSLLLPVNLSSFGSFPFQRPRVEKDFYQKYELIMLFLSICPALI